MAIFAVLTTYDNRVVRDRVRPSHRAFLQEQLDRGALISGGPFADDSGALLLFEVESREALKEIIDQDPYTQTPSCLESITVREWNRIFNRGQVLSALHSKYRLFRDQVEIVLLHSTTP
jgi:uncharacterized protein YciI